MINLLSSMPTQTIMIIVWLCICVGSLILEGITTEVVSIYFSFGALISMILAIANVPFWPQVFIWLAITFILLFTTRPIFIKYIKKNEIKTNTDALIGKKFNLEKEITTDVFGEVTISGVTWNATTIDQSSIEVNNKVEIVALEGSKLIVKKID